MSYRFVEKTKNHMVLEKEGFSPQQSANHTSCLSCLLYFYILILAENCPCTVPFLSALTQGVFK